LICKSARTSLKRYSLVQYLGRRVTDRFCAQVMKQLNSLNSLTSLRKDTQTASRRSKGLFSGVF
jgi:hypothetical protein